MNADIYELPKTAVGERTEKSIGCRENGAPVLLNNRQCYVTFLGLTVDMTPPQFTIVTLLSDLFCYNSSNSPCFQEELVAGIERLEVGPAPAREGVA